MHVLFFRGARFPFKQKYGTVVETSFATLKLDSPPLISIYYLPYKNGELKKIVFYSGHYNFSKWRLYEKGPKLGL